MAQVLDMGGGRFCALPSLGHLDGGACLFSESTLTVWYAVDGRFYAVLYEFEDVEDDEGHVIDEVETYDIEEWDRVRVVELLTEYYGAEKAEKLLTAVFSAERGEPKTATESIAYLSAELTALQDVDLRRADEDERAAYAVRSEKISRLLARVVRSMKDEPGRGVLLYDVKALLNGALKNINTPDLT